MDTECSRRDLLTAGTLGIAGVTASLIIPPQAHASEEVKETTVNPAIKILIKDREGKILDNYNPLSKQNTLISSPLKIANTKKTVKVNNDETITVQCITSINSRSANTVAEESYETEEVAATVSLDYLFSRGQITVRSGSVNITRIASNVEMYSRYLIVAQGPYGGSDTIIEQFTGNTHTVTTNFSPTTYVPSGPSHMNICRFESGILIDGTEDYFFDVEVTV